MAGEEHNLSIAGSEITRRVYLLSPANCAGKRAQELAEAKPQSPLAAKLHSETGASLGELFTFMSGLYFRGKLSYAEMFATPPPGSDGVLVIVPGRGLRSPDVRLTANDLREIASVSVQASDPRYRTPLVRDTRRLAQALSGADRVILLGSVATPKYVEPLIEVLGNRLFFPESFVGRGDMSRGGLLLRCARAGRRLAYVPVRGSERRGPRPPRLTDGSVEQLAQ